MLPLISSTDPNPIKTIWLILLDCNRLYPGFIILVIFGVIAFVVLTIMGIVGISKIGKDESYGSIHTPWGDS